MVLIVLLAGAVAFAAALAVVLHRRERRVQAAEAALAEVTSSWSEDGSSRGRVCSAARLVADARVALLAEPTGRGALRVSAAAGAPADVLGEQLALDPDGSLTARAFLLGAAVSADRRAALPDAEHPLVRVLGARAAHAEPVFREGRLVGVLTLAWEHDDRGLAADRLDLVAALACEAARAIERDAHVSLLARQARTDELTALPNRRAWDEAVTREMARAQRTGEPLCVALLDLDHFKAYNDRFGHQAGDAHLRRTAALWRRELRAIDVLARYGGEEFGILLPNCDAARAREVVDRVRAATPNGETASAGVVVYDGRESADSLVARADAALYRAKHAGRSTTVPA